MFLSILEIFLLVFCLSFNRLRCDCLENPELPIEKKENLE